MKQVYTNRDLRKFDLPIDRSRWTVVIPAAGKGTRLGYHKPKILYPVAGRPILEWLVRLFSGLCKKYVFVLSSQKVSEVDAYLKEVVTDAYEIAIQPEPNGMGSAVLRGLEYVDTEFAAAIWGDQVGVRRETVVATMCIQEHRPNAVFTCPTVFRKKPYIHFQRDKEKKITEILQVREGDAMPDRGESDCGFFVFDATRVRQCLEESSDEGAMVGRKTGEFNFLPVIPYLDRVPGNVAVLRTIQEEETIGVNTKEDAEIVSQFLSSVPT